jgi:uncharacterized RDD family membrane protein YckC
VILAILHRNHGGIIHAVLEPTRSGASAAGFWIRVAAALVDLVLLGVVQLSLGLVGGRIWGRDVDALPVFQTMVGLFTLLFSCLYATVLHSAGGQTIGKLLVGVRVLGVEGEPLTAGAALLRWFGYFASLATLGAGFVMAGLRRDKRALHDLIAGSRVEREQRPAPVPEAEEHSAVA